MKEISLTTPSGDCTILIGKDTPSLDILCRSARIVIVTDSTLSKLYASRLKPYDIIEVANGDSAKTPPQLEFLYSEFFKRKLERNAFIIGFGGGAVCDLAGFAAATYLRGLSYGTVATTLLAQVDASIGGKNGINFSGIKNLIGTIRQPEFCICDTSLLLSLPIRDLACGFAEIIKHAVIADREFFNFLELNSKAALALDPVIEEIIHQSIIIKSKIVTLDETENGERRKLNFGHTLGHAIEVTSNIPHGEAVSLGMVIEAKLSTAMQLLNKDDLERIKLLLNLYKLPINYSLESNTLIEAMLYDKKRSQQKINMILLDAIGSSKVSPIPITQIQEILSL